jgi:hypothetical protein
MLEFDSGGQLGPDSGTRQLGTAAQHEGGSPPRNNPVGLQLLPSCGV